MLGACGGLGAVAAGAKVAVPVGPFDTTLSLRPRITGDTVVRLPPLGTLRLDTHDGWLGVDARVDAVRLDAARRLVRDPRPFEGLEDRVSRDARDGLVSLAGRALLVSAAGGAAACGLRRPRLSAMTAGAVVGAGVTVGSLALAGLTHQPDAVSRPVYTGVLTLAPQAVGDAREITTRFSRYQDQLSRLVGNLSVLYRTAEGLPSFDPQPHDIRILHVSDLHLNPGSFDLITQVVRQFHIDAVVDTGDITDWGTEPEARFVASIARLGVPYVYVRGNHDSAATQSAIAAQPNAVVLDGTSRQVAGLRFFGVGDPRFTPDKEGRVGPPDQEATARAFAPTLARQLRRAQPPSVDVLLVHDLRLAARAGELVPLILAGHTHRPRQARIGEAVTLVEGSTGGGGLRTLESGRPTPLTCSVLYFDAGTRRLQAFDRIRVAGLGESGARIDRHLVAQPDRSAETG